MLAQTTLQQFTKESQTDFENILREYLQHLFLSYFYQNDKSDQILFKGGTALRIVLSSPRFSEDLDFTGINVSHQEIENIINNTLNNIEKILALLTRQKPRDFYDYYYLLSNNYPQVKEKENLQKVLELLKTSKINFRSELRKFLPISHYLHLKNFKEVLEQKIKNFL